MLQNAYFLAKIGADTAENEQHFAEILPTNAGRCDGFGTGPPKRFPLRSSERSEGAAPQAFCLDEQPCMQFPKQFFRRAFTNNVIPNYSDVAVCKRFTKNALASHLAVFDCTLNDAESFLKHSYYYM